MTEINGTRSTPADYIQVRPGLDTNLVMKTRDFIHDAMWYITTLYCASHKCTKEKFLEIKDAHSVKAEIKEYFMELVKESDLPGARFLRAACPRQILYYLRGDIIAKMAQTGSGNWKSEAFEIANYYVSYIKENLPVVYKNYCDKIGGARRKGRIGRGVDKLKEMKERLGWHVKDKIEDHAMDRRIARQIKEEKAEAKKMRRAAKEAAMPETSRGWTLVEGKAAKPGESRLIRALRALRIIK